MVYDKNGRISTVYGANSPLSQCYDKAGNPLLESASIKWSVIGDSLSDDVKDGEGNYANPHYYTVVTEHMNVTLDRWSAYADVAHPGIADSVPVFAYGGSGYCKSYNISKAFYQRSGLISANSDIVTIFGSINDWQTFAGQGGIPIGNVSDTASDADLNAGTGNASMYAYMNKCIEKIRSANANCKICIVSLPWYSLSSATNMSVARVHPIRTGLFNFAKHNNLPFYDFTNDYGYTFGSGVPGWENHSVWSGYIMYRDNGLTEAQKQARINFASTFLADFKTDGGAYGHWNSIYNRYALAPMFEDVIKYECGLSDVVPPTKIDTSGSLPAIMYRGLDGN